MNQVNSWSELNDSHLQATTDWILLRLAKLAKGDEYSDQALELAYQQMLSLEATEQSPALLILQSVLGLSTFDREVLALCVAMELNSQTAQLCAQAQNNTSRNYPTFSLAFSLFDDADWGALSPHAPLRYFRLLEINQPGNQTLTTAALTADERVVNYIKGLNYLDDRLVPFISPIKTIGLAGEVAEIGMAESQQTLINTIVAHYQHSSVSLRPPFIELIGTDSGGKQLVAARVSQQLGLNLQIIDLKTMPSQMGEFETFTRLWQRENLLLPLSLMVEVKNSTENERILLKRFLEKTNGVVFLDLDDSRGEYSPAAILYEVKKPAPEEQRKLWAKLLPESSPQQLQRVAQQFSFNQSDIVRLAKQTPDIWLACRQAARAGMEKLARRIDAKATWQQLVLPQQQLATLQAIADQVSCRSTVYEDWGFRQNMNRGFGINALFAGESGTGKTMAAEVIANALKLDLYRIDLSAVVSKYIGETEKNLARLFDAAEDSGAILLFDEADALFGKRSSVKDSHDRYANIEVNYLLQRMESYRGLAILATNMKGAMDPAFSRRLRFIVDFAFPDFEQRAEMWQKVFPQQTPVDQDFDCQRLASLNLSGGNIHSVALNAAFLAAKQSSPVTMSLIMDAARSEFKKLEKPSKETDFSCVEKPLARSVKKLGVAL
jgi:ATP-dependent 26S proteasome regulatory subunit